MHQHFTDFSCWGIVYFDLFSQGTYTSSRFLLYAWQSNLVNFLRMRRIFPTISWTRICNYQRSVRNDFSRKIQKYRRNYQLAYATVLSMINISLEQFSTRKWFLYSNWKHEILTRENLIIENLWWANSIKNQSSFPLFSKNEIHDNISTTFTLISVFWQKLIFY